MSNTIQIKRSLLSAAPVTLLEGEFGFVFGTNTLYIGGPGGTIIIVAGDLFARLFNPVFTGLLTTPALKVTGGTPGIGKVLAGTDSAGNMAWASQAGGVTDHTALTSIGTRTHAQLETDIAAKGAIAGQTWTGAQNFPTQSVGNNTTLAATTAYVIAAINALLNGAGAAYDTLKELQDLLVGDESTASALAITVGGKAQKDLNLSDLTSAATARVNLGLGTMALQAASSVAITGGTINGITFDGGTF